MAESNNGYLVTWRKIGARRRALRHSSFDYGRVDLSVNYNVVSDVVSLSIRINDIVERAKYLRKAFGKTKSRNATIKVRYVQLDVGFKVLLSGGRIIVSQEKFQKPTVGSMSFNVSGGDPLGAWIVEKVMNKYGKPRLRDVIQDETLKALRKYLPREAADLLKKVPYVVNGYRMHEPLVLPSANSTLLETNYCRAFGFAGVLDRRTVTLLGNLKTYTHITCRIR